LWWAKAVRALVLLIVLLQLSGCGFQLRQATELPAGLVGLEVKSANELSPMAIELHRTLGQNQLKANSTHESRGVLEVLSESVRREVLSVNDRARVSEYVLIADVSVRLLDGSAEAKEIIAPFSLSLRREYSFDERQALGAAQEEEIIGQELRRDLAQGVLARLAKR
jgi:LPS-assembly lipoprotein